MELQNYISRCRHPKVLINKHGKEVITSCGKCVDCKASRLSVYTQKAVQEGIDNKFAMFITLTYDDIHAPVCRIYKDDNFIKYVDITKRRLHRQNSNSVVKTTANYNKCIHEIDLKTCSYKLFQKFMEKSYKKSNLYKPRKYPYLYVLNKKDLQNFIKRLRFYFRKDFDAEIRYFAVGEYSPQHFRPHYHIILYYNDARLTKVCRNYVTKCWQYGLNDTQPARSGKGCSSYVAGYLNSFAKLPYFLDGKQISPFCLHSQFLGVQNLRFLRETIYSTQRYTFEPVVYQINGTLYSISLASQIKSYFFPRCYNYELQTTGNKLFLYTVYSRLSKALKTDSIRDIIKSIYSFDYYLHYSVAESIYFIRKRLLSLLDIDIDLFSGHFVDFEEHLNDEHEEFMTLYNRIYTCLLTSRKFCENSLFIPNLSTFESIEDVYIRYYRIIDNFYYQFEQYRLRQQYINMDKYLTSVDDTGNVDIFFPINKFMKYSNEDFDVVLKENSYIQAINHEKDIKYSKKIKHKALDDANDIFTNLKH